MLIKLFLLIIQVLIFSNVGCGDFSYEPAASENNSSFSKDLVEPINSPADRAISPSDPPKKQPVDTRYDIFGFDKKGFHKDTHIHRDTGIEYGPNGLDFQGFDIDGFHPITNKYKDGTDYNPDGWNYLDFNRSGFNKLDHKHKDTKDYYDPSGHDYLGFDLKGFHKDSHINKNTNKPYDQSGFDYLGQNSFGFDKAHNDIKGLDSPSANSYREQKATEYLKALSDWGFPITDVNSVSDSLADDEAVTTLLKLKELHKDIKASPIKPAPAPLPSDRELYQSIFGLYKIVKNLRDKNMLKLDSFTLSRKKAKQFGQFLDFTQLWQQELKNNPLAQQDFYLKIYKALNNDWLLFHTDFPDESDRDLNISSRPNLPQSKIVENINIKRDFLILALASIKFSDGRRSLDSNLGIYSRIDHPYAKTSGQPAFWFAEMRYKLFKSSLNISSLDNNDKALFLVELLHAGKHCTDAKRRQIENLLNKFNSTEVMMLEEKERSLATTLAEKIQMIATKLKFETLTNAIGVLKIQRDSADESVTIKAATWDKYASLFGLRRVNADYPQFAQTISEDTLFGSSPIAYTKKRLFDKTKSELGKEICDFKTPLFSMHLLSEDIKDLLILSTLLEYGFF